MLKSGRIMNTFKDNPYQYTRGIRFKLSPEIQSKEFREKYNFDNQEIELFKEVDSSQKKKESAEQKIDNERKSLSELSDLLLNFQSDLKLFLYIYPKNSDPIFRKELSVNKTWLKHWHKEIFYLWIKNDSNKQGKYFLADLKDLHPSFPDWLNKWEQHSSVLKAASKSPKHSQFRHSTVAEHIRNLLSRSQWDYIYKFLEEVHTKYNVELDKKIAELKNELKQIRERLKTEEKTYLSSQSLGVEITKASFNYYTVDKKKKDYEDEIKKAKDRLHEYSFSTIQKIKSGKYRWAINQDQFKRKGGKRS